MSGDGRDALRDQVIAGVRKIEVGPFGPNSMAILNRDGFVRLTTAEAEQVADALAPILATHVDRAVDAALEDAAMALEDVNVAGWALAGQRAGADAAGIVRGKKVGRR